MADLNWLLDGITFKALERSEAGTYRFAVEIEGSIPDTAAGDLAAIAAALGGTLTVELSGDLPDTVTGDLAAIAAALAGVLAVKTEGATVSQTPAITAGAYAAGDAVGGLLTFAGAARESGGGGVTKSLVIIDDAGQDAELELWLFNQTFTAMANNAPWAPSEADLENLVAVISTEDSAQGWLAAGTPSVVDIEVAKRYDAAGTSLFGQLVTRGTPTFAAVDDLTVKLGLLQD